MKKHILYSIVTLKSVILFAQVTIPNSNFEQIDENGKVVFWKDLADSSGKLCLKGQFCNEHVLFPLENGNRFARLVKTRINDSISDFGSLLFYETNEFNGFPTKLIFDYRCNLRDINDLKPAVTVFFYYNDKQYLKTFELPNATIWNKYTVNFSSLDLEDISIEFNGKFLVDFSNSYTTEDIITSQTERNVLDIDNINLEFPIQSLYTKRISLEKIYDFYSISGKWLCKGKINEVFENLGSGFFIAASDNERIKFVK